MKFVLLALLSQQAFGVTWNFSDWAGNVGLITVDESRVVPCPELPAGRNGSISLREHDFKLSACADGDTLFGISSNGNGINFVMELHYITEEFLLWSATRKFENSTLEFGCDSGVTAGAILVFQDEIENPGDKVNYFCLK